MATLIDKLLVIPTLCLVLGQTIFAALTGPFRGSEGAPRYIDHVKHTAIRGLVTNMSTSQLQWLSPPFVDTYKSWCSKQSLQPDIVDIPNTNPSAQGFWIGSKSTAKYTMVFYHGGGFAIAGSEGHLNMILNFVKWSNNNLAVFCVSYSLSPGAIYPTAIAQCVEGLRYILDLPGHSPATTLLGGDSAGGNLLLAVLSHISGHAHQNSSLVRSLDVSAPLKGAIAISPWTSSDSSKYPSVQKYGNRDIVNNTCATYWSETYKGRGSDLPDDEFIWAATAAPEWWRNSQCEQLLATAGEEEVLVDAISDWAEKYKMGAGADKIKYVIGEREIHDTPLNGLGEAKLEALGDKTQEGAIRLWIKDKLT